MKNTRHDNLPGSAREPRMPVHQAPPGEGATPADIARGYKKVEGDKLEPAFPDRNDRYYGRIF